MANPRGKKFGKDSSDKKKHPFSKFSDKKKNSKPSFGKKTDRRRDEESGDREKPKRFDRGGDKPFKKSFSKDEGHKRPFRKTERDDERPFKKRDDHGEKKGRGYKDNDRSDKRRSSGDDKPYFKKDRDGDRPFKKRDDHKEKYSSKHKDDDRERPFKKRDGDSRDSKFKSGDRERSYKKEESGYKKRYSSDDDDRTSEKKHSKENEDTHYRPFKKEYDGEKKYSREEALYARKQKKKAKPEKEFDGLTRLNKYLSNAGICSRREADDLIKAGAVSVNGKVITEMGFKIKAGDVVNYGGETLRSERKVYLLLNKPKDYITTTDDPQERHTVMELIEGACKERVYPVGRLDRNTLGLLLFTNDGELATKLMHPKHDIRKVYQVTVNRSMKAEDFSQLEEGFDLEDGFIKADEVSYTGEGKKEIGIEIHSGRNRIVRRMFEHLGYEVVKLDRVAYAGLTKKDLPRGKWRFLNPKEVGFLKMLG